MPTCHLPCGTLLFFQFNVLRGHATALSDQSESPRVAKRLQVPLPIEQSSVCNLPYKCVWHAHSGKQTHTHTQADIQTHTHTGRQTSTHTYAHTAAGPEHILFYLRLPHLILSKVQQSFRLPTPSLPPLSLALFSLAKCKPTSLWQHVVNPFLPHTLCKNIK